MKDDPIAELERRVRRGAGRSPLRRWLTARREELLPVLGVPGRDDPPDWHTVTDVLSKVRFGGRPLSDGGGQTLTPERVRKTWWKVVQAGAAYRAEQPRHLPTVEMLRPTAPKVPVAAQKGGGGHADEKIQQLLTLMGRRGPRLPGKVE